jgi:hypothetical protein
LELNINLNAKDAKWKTCVHHAAENGQLKVLEYLEDFDGLSFDDQVDFCATIRNGDSAIHLAARNGKNCQKYYR